MEKNHDANMTIGRLAQQVGVNVETVRYYQRRGLLQEPARAWGTVRRYGAAHLARLRFVKSAQRLGFSLDEIAELLQLADGTHCDEASQLAARRLADVRARLADLARIESVLADLLVACGAAQAGAVWCPLIAALQREVETAP